MKCKKCGEEMRTSWVKTREKNFFLSFIRTISIEIRYCGVKGCPNKGIVYAVFEDDAKEEKK